MANPYPYDSGFDPLTFIASVPWIGARGEYDRDGLRHQYVARKDVADQDAFTAFAQACLDRGYRRRFGKHTYRYLEVGDGFRYWIMWGNAEGARIINRCEASASWADPREED